jgi:hypothetical protein
MMSNWLVRATIMAAATLFSAGCNQLLGIHELPGGEDGGAGTTTTRLDSSVSTDSAVGQGCADGGCDGVCKPGATQCSADGLEVCGPNGMWGAPMHSGVAS